MNIIIIDDIIMITIPKLMDPVMKNLVHCQIQSPGTGNNSKTSPCGQVSDVLNGPFERPLLVCSTSSV